MSVTYISDINIDCKNFVLLWSSAEHLGTSQMMSTGDHLCMFIMFMMYQNVSIMQVGGQGKTRGLDLKAIGTLLLCQK